MDASKPNCGESTCVSEIMTREPVRVAIVDSKGRPIGVLSKTDLVRDRRRISAAKNELVAGDVMTPVAFTLSETAALSDAAALMVHEGVHRIPVVSNTGEVVGVVSSIDVLRWIAEREGYLLPKREIRRAAVEE